LQKCLNIFCFQVLMSFNSGSFYEFIEVLHSRFEQLFLQLWTTTPIFPSVFPVWFLQVLSFSRRPLFAVSNVNSNLDSIADLHSHPSSDIRRQRSSRLSSHWLLLGGGSCWPGFYFGLIRLFWLFRFDFASQTEQFTAAASLSIHEKSLDAR